MKRETVLIKNTLIITIGKICTQMISFFLLPLYTAILTTEQYGVVDLLNTLIALLAPIVTLQIEQALFRHLIDVREKKEDIKTIISTTIFFVIIQMLIYLLIFSLSSKWIHNEYKVFLFTNLIASIFSSIMLQISRGLGDNINYAIGSFITAMTMIIFNIVFLLIFDMGAYGMLCASLLANILCGIYIFITKKIYNYISIKKIKKQILKEMFKYSIPLIPNALSWWIFNFSDRVIVSAVLGIAANGILATSHKFSTVYITIYNIFNMTWTESAAMYIDDEDSDNFFSKIINSMFAIFSCICFGIITVMPFIFPIMINKTYGGAYYQIPILMLASLANVGIGLISVIYIAKKQTKEIAKNSVISAIINIVVHLVLIKFVGLYAASVSTLIAYLLMFIYRSIDIKKYIELKIDKRLLFSTLIMAIIILVQYYIKNLILNIIMFNVTVIYSVIINRKNIKFVINTMLKRIEERRCCDEK